MNKNLIANLSIFLVLFLAVWFGILPMWSGISSVRAEIKSNEETVNLERKAIEKLNLIRQILDSKKTSVERLKQAIPTTELKPELLSIMENIASQNGLVLNSINIDTAAQEVVVPGESTEGTGSEVVSFKKIMVNVRTSGNYWAFKSWLNAIESSLRITDISRILFSVSAKESESGELESNIDPIMDYTVDMTTYYLNK
jgi:Tfp pilus assembly protein PilO